MADSNALLASLLLGQKQRVDPLDAQRKYGQGLIVKASSTEPLHGGGWVEGLSRALQGGIGGLVAGYADKQAKDEETQNIGAMQAGLAAKTPEEFATATKGLKGTNAEALLASLLQGKQDQFARTGAGATFAGGFSPTQGTPGPGNNGTSITITPKAPDNNPMNIRTSGIPWDGKTTPPGSSFETFANPQAGANATAKNFASYVRENPNITVGEAIAKWAPAGDGANDPQAYAARIAQAGIPPTARMADVLADPNAFAKLAIAGTGVEKGGVPPGFTPETFTAAATRAQGGAQSPGPQVAQAQVPSGTPNPQMQGDTGPAPSVVSQPPEVPRPQPTPEQVQRYRSMVEAKGGMTIEQANQGLNKEITDQWQADKMRALAIWQDQQQSKRIQETGAQRLGQEAPMTMIKDRVSNYETKVRPAAMSAINDIQSINQTRQILDAGAFTGTGAEAKTLAAKVGEQLGIPSDQAQNTQVLGATLAKRVLAGAGGTLGTGFSNADRDFMEKAQGGQLSMDEGALRRILDIGEKQARQTLKNHDTEAARVMQLPGMGQLGAQQFQVPQAPTYDEFNKANPLAPLQTSPQGQAAPQTQLPKVSSPDEALKLGSGKKFLLPDGRVGTVP